MNGVKVGVGVVGENCCMFLLETDISIIINQVSHDIDHTYVWKFHFHWQRLKNKVMSQFQVCLRISC